MSWPAAGRAAYGRWRLVAIARAIASAHAREVVALLGPNGAGKSTVC